MQPDRKQSVSSILSLISSLNVPLTAMLNPAADGAAKRPKEGQEYRGENEWPPKDFRVSLIHNG